MHTVVNTSAIKIKDLIMISGVGVNCDMNTLKKGSRFSVDGKIYEVEELPFVRYDYGNNLNNRVSFTVKASDVSAFDFDGKTIVIL